jgi:hypothetical protein
MATQCACIFKFAKVAGLPNLSWWFQDVLYAYLLFISGGRS